MIARSVNVQSGNEAVSIMIIVLIIAQHKDGGRGCAHRCHGNTVLCYDVIILDRQL